MKSSFALWSIWEMLNLPIGQLFLTYHAIASFSQMLSAQTAKREGVRLQGRTHPDLLEAAEEFCRICSDCGLLVTAGPAEKLCKELKCATPEPGDTGAWVMEPAVCLRVHRACGDVIACLRSETSITTAMLLPAESIRWYSPKTPLFGGQVDTNFPSLVYEIEESGKCLALGRSTAAAFHAIRSLEAGITAISRCLAIPDPTKGADRNWGAMLKKIQAELDRRWVGAASRMTGDGAVFEGLYGVLQALQNPYRNATMHFDQKYTTEEAKHIFEMVAGVMRKIASRMDENGLPLA